MKKILTLFILFLTTIRFAAIADEGMWLLTLLNKNYQDMKKQGFQLTPEDVYSVNQSSLKDAVVMLGGYCTGEIVSDKGLMLTNHHCGYRTIQLHSTVENDYLKDGFWAMSLEEELVTPDLFVRFLNRMEDVTDKVNKKLNDKMTEKERKDAINEVRKTLVAKYEEKPFQHARLQSFFGGNQFFLVVYDQYSDVRLVGAPPSSIGNFGDDTDNWMWPRHTGDFCMFRIYMSPDGKPAKYAADNIPYKPRHFFPVSLAGVKKDDFAMVMGYPGGTDRYMTSFGVREVMEITNPNRIEIRGIKQEIMLKDMEASDKVRIQYASKYSFSTNYWKYSIGQNKGLRQLKIIDKKKALEARFTDWVNADAKRKQKYGETLDIIKEAYKNRRPYDNAYQYIYEVYTRGTEAISFAAEFRKLAGLLKDTEANADKIKAEIKQLKEQSADFYKNYNPPTDKKISLAMLNLYQDKIDEKFQPDIYEVIKDKYDNDIEKFVQALFGNSIFINEDRVNKFLKNPDIKVLTNDLAYKASISFEEKRDEIAQKVRTFATQLQKGSRQYIAGLMQMQDDKLFYPDANFTMRLTYGKVGDYSPRDAVDYDYYTTLSGVMEKEDPTNPEFIVPEKLKELYNKKDYGQYGMDGKMVVCFTTNNDITGGNSGSPVLNGKGELIGIAFDGNWEAMSGDIVFEPELQKCINVDIRYVLFVIDKFAGASHLVKEMKLVD